MKASRHIALRGAMLSALADGVEPGDRAEALDGVASALVSDRGGPDTPGFTALVARFLAEAVLATAELERWESDVLAAAPDAERHRRAANLRAKRALEKLEGEAGLDPLRALLSNLAEVDNLDRREAVRAELRAVPLPIALIDPPPGRSSARTREPEAPASPTPRVAIVASLDGTPVTAPYVLTPGKVHELAIEARVLDWPGEAHALTIRALSRWPASAMELPEVRLLRPADGNGDAVLVARGSSHLLLHASATDPLEPIEITFEGEFTFENENRIANLIGHPQLRVRTFDPAADVITGAPALDEHILRLLSKLREEGIAPSEQEAFGRFLGAINRAGVAMAWEREFPEGTRPTEARFQDELRKRLKMATELGGRLAEHAWQGGGQTDLAHDEVVAELKVERDTPATIDTATKYLAQSTQYASGGQRQLSILVILDMTSKDEPPGVLANSVGIIEPKLHGLDDPAYPSRVAVVIINGALPLPSDWSH